MGDSIIVWVRNDKRAINPNEDYFLAKVEKNALQLDAGGVYSAMKHKKNDLIVFVCWYIFVLSKTNTAGDRFYSNGFAHLIHCNPITRNLEKYITLKWVSRYYKLDKSLHDHVEKHGDISY